MTLLAVHSYPGVNDLVRQLWPYYEMSGWDICGIGTEDGFTEWPRNVPFFNVGRDAYIEDNSNLPNRLIGTIKYFLSTEYSHLCIIEYDCVFLGKVEFYKIGITCHKAGNGVEGFKAHTFYHVPWFMDRQTAERIVKEGEILISQGVYEGGSPDFFLGLCLQNLGIRPTESCTFSVNSLDTKENMDSAKSAVKRGCKFFHGIKTMEQLREMLS